MDGSPVQAAAGSSINQSAGQAKKKKSVFGPFSPSPPAATAHSGSRSDTLVCNLPEPDQGERTRRERRTRQLLLSASKLLDWEIASLPNPTNEFPFPFSRPPQPWQVTRPVKSIHNNLVIFLFFPNPTQPALDGWMDGWTLDDEQTAERCNGIFHLPSSLIVRRGPHCCSRVLDSQGATPESVTDRLCRQPRNTTDHHHKLTKTQ